VNEFLHEKNRNLLQNLLFAIDRKADSKRHPICIRALYMHIRAMLNNVCNITVGRSAVGQWNASDRGQVAQHTVTHHFDYASLSHMLTSLSVKACYFMERKETDFSRFVAFSGNPENLIDD